MVPGGLLRLCTHSGESVSGRSEGSYLVIHSILAALPSRAAASCSILPARIVLPLLFVPSQVYPKRPRHAGDEVGIGAQLWVVPTTTSLIHACRGQMQLAYG